MTLTVLAAISLSLPLVFGEETKASPDQDKSDDFWNSVYEDNHVVEIDISLTKLALQIVFIHLLDQNIDSQIFFL